MSRPRGPSNPHETRRRLIEAAARRFAAQGYPDTSLAEVARDAGITAPSLLYHFPSKEALFNAVLRDVWGNVREQLVPLLAQDLDAEAMLASVVVGLASYERDEDPFGEMLAALLSGAGVGAEAAQDTFLPLIEELEGAVRQAASPPPPELAPIREVLLYVIFAHSAQRQLGQLLPGEVERLEAREPAFVLTLLRAALGPLAEQGPLRERPPGGRPAG
jgi:AcrR family transcriptional regulator